MLEGVEKSYDERPTRPCMSCGQNDKAPRDVVGLPDGNLAYYHKDCHAMLGCAVCKEELDVVAGGSDPRGKKNEDLWRAIIEAGDDETPVPDFYTRDDVTGNYAAAIAHGEMKDDTWSADQNGGNK